MAGRGGNVADKSGTVQIPDRSEGEEKGRKKQKCVASKDETAALFLMASGRSVSLSAEATAHAEAMLMEGQAGNQSSFSAGCSSVAASGSASQLVCDDAGGKADDSRDVGDFDGYGDEFWDSLDMTAMDALIEETLAANARQRAEEAEMENRKGKAMQTAAAGGTRFCGGSSGSFQSASSLLKDGEECDGNDVMAPPAAPMQQRGGVPMQTASNAGPSSSAGSHNPGNGNLSSALEDIFFGNEGQEGNNRRGFPPAAFYAQENAGANDAQGFRPPGRAADARMHRPAVAVPAQQRAMPSRPAGSHDQHLNANFQRGPAVPPPRNTQSGVPAVACGQSPAAFQAPRSL